MKLCSTCFLLAITSLYFLGGHFCFRVIYAVEVEYRMDAEERAVAEALRAETGLQPNVKILRDYERTAMSGGYSGIFVFSREIEDREVHYIVDPYPTQTVEKKYVVGHRPRPDRQKEKAFFFQRLFSPFILYDVPMTAFSRAKLLAEQNFCQYGLRDLFTPSVPTPPPQFA